MDSTFCREVLPYCIENKFFTLFGKFADKPTRDQSSRGLDNSRTSGILYFTCISNL